MKTTLSSHRQGRIPQINLAQPTAPAQPPALRRQELRCSGYNAAGGILRRATTQAQELRQGVELGGGHVFFLALCLRTTSSLTPEASASFATASSLVPANVGMYWPKLLNTVCSCPICSQCLRVLRYSACDA